MSEETTADSTVKSSPRISRTHDVGLAPVPFIVGCSRSGTTLLRLMLDAHPDLAIPAETHFIPAIVPECATAGEPRRRFVEQLTSFYTWQDFGIDAQVLERRVEDIEPFRIDEALRVFFRLYAERWGKSRWGEKTPSYCLHMRLIHQLLPEARFIHMIRDGRDVALSHRDKWFGPKQIDEAAQWWVDRITATRIQVADVPFYLEVNFEELVLEPEATLRKISEFIELPWDPAVLEYHKHAAERVAEVSHDLVRPDSPVVPALERVRIHAMNTQPLAVHRIARWRTEMPASDRVVFERIAGGLLQELGYEVA
jgi:hypothetical protein